MITSEPRRLTDDETPSWLALAGVLVRLPAELDAQLQRDAGISHFEYQVLAGLSEAPDRTLRMSELAVFAHGSLSRLSHVARRLEDRGWLRREPDPDNGRFTVATLTEAGWAKAVGSAPSHVATVRRLVFDPLTRAQVRQLHEIGRRILAATEDAGRPLG
ncbi:MarR family winged helix-turn-helix transcriptional regulator [Streptomyces sp. NPDC058683]|uniref:MarR family winged helix-turn-helix transcriptional regulator n=1 Tax=Streptomyces sp. NPDC058683 TaxID=3346597 RepID=UPI003658CD8F